MTINIEKIEKAAEQKFGSFRQFCIQTGQDETNFKRKLKSNLNKINNWIEPVQLEISINKK
jgi:hypothetical protein